MKRIILLNLILLCLSCGNDETIKNRITELETQNQVLLDSLEKLAVLQVYSSEIIILPENSDLKQNEKNRFVGYIVEHQKYLKYNLYKVDTTHYTAGAKKELIGSGLTDYKFDFEYIPEKQKENWIHILAEFDLDSVKVQMPGIVIMDAK